MENTTGSQSADQDFGDPSDLLDLVRSAWQDTLEFDPEDDHAGFFDSGGDSHQLFVLIERLSRTGGVRLGTTDVIDADTISGMADLIVRTRRAKLQEPADGS